MLGRETGAGGSREHRRGRRLRLGTCGRVVAQLFTKHAAADTGESGFGFGFGRLYLHLTKQNQNEKKKKHENGKNGKMKRMVNIKNDKDKKKNVENIEIGNMTQV